MSTLLLRIASIYSLVGVGLGIHMAAQHDFTNRGVHAHANLVGWVSMALMALAYRAFPGLANTPWARAQFWLHNLGLPVMLVGLAALLHGVSWGEPVVGIGSSVVALAFASFAINVWRNAHA
jgi:hypothetical protein